MKKLKTKNKIPNAGRNGFNTFDSFITLEIVAYNEVMKNNNHTIEVQYKYLDDNGTDVSVNSNIFIFNSSTEINMFSSQIMPLIPTELSHTELFDNKILIGAQLKMAQTLGIDFNDIEQID